MDARKNQERQMARRQASDPRLRFITRRKVKEKKDAQLERIIRDLEWYWQMSGGRGA